MMEVIVLAGGLGTRLRSAVSEVPKCMAPVDGKPFLQYVLDYLAHFEVSRVILSVGYLREAVTGWMEAHRADYPFAVDYAVETEPLGTGGGLRLALSKAHTDPVMALNGDTFFQADLDACMAEAVGGGGAVSIALKPMEDFDRYGSVVLRDHLVLGFKEKEYCRRGLINGGIYLINRRLLDLEGLPDKFPFETDVLIPEASKGHVRGFVHDDYFIDIGLPEDYRRAQRELPELMRLMQLSRIDGFETLFLDRDGVINRLRPDDYVKTWEEFEWMPGIFYALREWAKRFRHIILVTNQSGVGKGLMTEAALKEILARMRSEISAHGGRLDAMYYSPHLAGTSPMRKPGRGMFEAACRDFPDIRPETSVMIGDAESDMQFAANCGMKGVKL